MKCLIANGADVTIGHGAGPAYGMQSWTPITTAIWMLSNDSEQSSVIMSDIFDLLLNTAVKKKKDHLRNFIGYVMCANYNRNITCMLKLIKMGTPRDIIAYDEEYMWERAASMGNIELLECMFNRGIDKDTTMHNGFTVLWCVVSSGNIESVHYLLDLGVAIPTFTPEVPKTQCEECKEDILIIDRKQINQNPSMRAINSKKLDMVKLFVEYGSEDYKSFCALKHAVACSNVDVTSYLLNKYTYPLNAEYIIKDYCKGTYTLLTDPFTQCTAQITKLLLDHGADPAKPICGARSANAIMTAVYYRSVEVVAQYIRYGVDINFESRTRTQGRRSPFEASLLNDRPYVSVMLLISGCSRGVFSNLKLKIKPKLEKLMKEWKVYDNNVIPLQQRCRCVILNHLSPRADQKIQKLPLPSCLVKFLGIPELDKIVYDNDNDSNNDTCI